MRVKIEAEYFKFEDQQIQKVFKKIENDPVSFEKFYTKTNPETG